jgi:hypothetical protein
MDLDLADLREMHPLLPEDLTLVMIGRAALSLQKNGHGAPVSIRLDLDRVVTHGKLAWPESDPGFLVQHDSRRLTEDGAEAIALAYGHKARGWRVVRRMQQGESADWLLEASSEGTRQRIALEVSGVARGSITARLTQKLKQVSESEDVDQQWAGIVGFEEPMTALRSLRVAKS